MALYSLLDAASDLVGLGSIVSIIVSLVSSVQPLFERVRDSFRACQPPEERVQLLGYAFLISVAWVAAAAQYFRILFSLWDVMGAWFVDQPINWRVYALLQFYLVFLLVCGGYACAITIVEVSGNRKVLNDLWVIAGLNRRKYEVAEDMEAQHLPSSPNLVASQTEVASVVDDVYYTSSLPQDEDSCKNDQDLNEDITLSRPRTNESEHPMEEAAWSEIDQPVRKSMTKTAYSSIRDGNVRRSFWPRGGVWNKTEAVRSSNQYQAILDSDGEVLVATLSSSPSSSASSEVDERDIISDDNDQRVLPGVRLHEHVEVREQSNRNGLHIIIDKRGYVKGDDDSGLCCHATPHPGPQHQNAKPDLEPLDMEYPPSPCDSCSSTYAESITTAKRSPVRVPITPTSPTADAEDADTEEPDVERTKRDRRTRNPALHIRRIIIPPRTSAPHDARILSFETETKRSDGKECTRVLHPNLAAPTLDQGARPSTNNEYGSSNPNLNQAPCTHPTSPSSSPDPDSGLFWRSRESSTDRNNNNTTTAPADSDSNDDDDDDDGEAHIGSFDGGQWIIVKGTMGSSGTRSEGKRRVGLAATGTVTALPGRKRRCSLYPFGVGGIREEKKG